VLAVAVSGALVAGGGLVAGPAFAGPDTTQSGSASVVDDPIPTPDPTTTGDSTPDPTATTVPP
jgi:hypothetical protein